MASVARKKLISRLEGTLSEHIVNNGNNIRYPLTFIDGSKLKGNYILNVSDSNLSKFFPGKYIFGANELHIYKALDAVLDHLECEGLIDEYALDELEEREGD